MLHRHPSLAGPQLPRPSLRRAYLAEACPSKSVPCPHITGGPTWASAPRPVTGTLPPIGWLFCSSSCPPRAPCPPLGSARRSLSLRERGRDAKRTSAFPPHTHPVSGSESACSAASPFAVGELCAPRRGHPPRLPRGPVCSQLLTVVAVSAPSFPWAQLQRVCLDPVSSFTPALFPLSHLQ